MNRTDHEAGCAFSPAGVWAMSCRRMKWLGLGACVWLLGLPAGIADAAPAVRVNDAGAIEGQSGCFDVIFEVSSGTFDLVAYVIELNVSGPTGGVRFTHFAEPRNPVFPGSVAEPVPDSPPLPAASAWAYDYLPAGSAAILDRAGLLRVWFETDLDSAGVYDVVVIAEPSRTNFADEFGGLLPVVSFLPGRITVIPDPPTLTWDGGSGEWGDSFWNLGSTSPDGAERMVVSSGHVTVEHDYTDQFAASLLIESGTVEVFPGGVLKTLFETTVAGGTLAVDGTLTAGELTVAPGGVLSGSGTIQTNVATIGGVLSPGGSFGPGTLTIDGDLRLGGDTILGGPGPGTADVPEPGTWVILATAAIGLLLRRCRPAAAG
jgi:hypothetical protein